MRYAANLDQIYCYPGTNILKNKFNIKDIEQLNKIEKIFTASRIVELQSQDLSHVIFDLNYLHSLHKTLFQDLYSWAGEFRRVNISKEIPFAQVEYIPGELNRIFSELHKENYLKGLSLDLLCERAAYYKAELNMIHPFREGNGRTLREFTRSLIKANHFELDYSLMNKDQYMFAMKHSAYTDVKPLEKLLKEVIIKSTVLHFKKIYGEKFPHLIALSDGLIMDIQKYGKPLYELKSDYMSYGHEIENGNFINQAKFNELQYIFTEIRAVNCSCKRNHSPTDSFDLSF